MSAYQYYEFQAVDRPLTPREMAELRALSTRARITATQFQNVYHWGDFKGSPRKLMEKYFDAFVYVAKWGTHQFMLGLPAGVLDQSVTRLYAVPGSLEVEASGERLILAFTSEDEEGDGWVEDAEAESWMPALLPLRADLTGGDQRALYLGWLAGARGGLLEDEDREPPLPPGLGSLTATLKALAEFLRLDEDLLAVAAAGSSELSSAPSTDVLRHWIADLSAGEKDALLLRLAQGNEARVRAELLGRFHQAHAPRTAVGAEGRTVADLLAAAEERATRRRRQEAERKAAERARREREQAAARAKYLDSIVGREDELWSQVEALIESKRPREYDQAAQILKDLHDLGVRRDDSSEFEARLGPLRERFARRPSFLKRLDRAGLTA